jgi:hypothetical protein
MSLYAYLIIKFPAILRNITKPSSSIFNMLVLLETPGGFGLFKVLNEKKLKSVEDLIKSF